MLISAITVFFWEKNKITRLNKLDARTLILFTVYRTVMQLGAVSFRRHIRPTKALIRHHIQPTKALIRLNMLI